MKTKHLLAVLVAIAVVVAPMVVTADTFIRQATHQDAMKMGPQTIPATDDTTETWLGVGKTRTQTAKGTVIIDGEKGMIYMIDDDKKTYSEIPAADLGNLEKMMGMEGMEEEEKAMMKQQMQAMMAMMQVSMTVTPTEETMEIKGWKCKKYLMDMSMGMAAVKSEAWVTKDVELDWSALWKLTNVMTLMMPGAEKVIEEAKKMEGIPVLSKGTATVMGQQVNSTTEVLEITTKDAPAGTYNLPEGYKKEDFSFGPGMN